jgi:hypothetical protein
MIFLEIFQKNPLTMLLGNFLYSKMVNDHHKENIVWASSTLNKIIFRNIEISKK